MSETNDHAPRDGNDPAPTKDEGLVVDGGLAGATAATPALADVLDDDLDAEGDR